MGQKGSADSANVLAAQGILPRGSELEQQLAKAGLEIIQIETGENPMDAARRLMPDVLLLALPENRTAFWEECRRWTSDPQTGRIPLLACAGELGPEERAAGYEAGILGFADMSEPPETLRPRGAEGNAPDHLVAGDEDLVESD